VVFVLVSAEAAPTAESLAWAAGAGAVGVVGLGAFYYALSRGTMGVIAPLAALVGAGLPVVLSIANGASVPPARMLGMALALVAVVLTSLPGGEHTDSERRRVRLEIAELPLILLSGLGFAGFFLFIDRASAAGETWWPLLIVRASGISLVLLALLVLARRARVHGGLVRGAGSLLGLNRLRTHQLTRARLAGLLLIVGLGDLGGNVFFLLSKHADAFALAVVLSSLYPVVTTILAVVFLHERLRPTQVAGIALATVSVALMG
jgi:drug/metabolite transporter (DMT)-like permease